MRYMSGNEMSAHEKAESVFRAVKTMFIDMQKIEYGSVNRMVDQLRVCMDLLYWKDRYVKETWSEKMDWWTNAKYYMEIVTGRLNECYAVYEAENSCDLPFDLYVGFLGLLDQCRRLMRQLIEEEPEWGEEEMELGPVRRVTKEEYEGRGRVRAEVRGYGPETGSGVEKEREMREMIEDLRNEVSALRDRVEKLERAKKPWSWGWGGSNVRKSPSDGGNGVDMETLLYRLNEMNLM
jgi:hypothetical protein